MTVFVLKIIAMTTMIIDHVGFAFCHDLYVMRMVGRLAFVTYAFLIAESYFHLREKPDRLRYHEVKLLLLCLITEIPFNMFAYGQWFYPERQSTLVLLWLGFSSLIAIGWWSKRHASRKPLAIAGSGVIIAAAVALSYLLHTEYNVAGVLLIVMFYVYLRKADELALPQRFAVLFVIAVVYLAFHIWVHACFGGPADFLYVVQVGSYRIVGTVLAIVPLALYNRKLGYSGKWFRRFYSIFYPLQFTVLALIVHCVG